MMKALTSGMPCWSRTGPLSPSTSKGMDARICSRSGTKTRVGFATTPEPSCCAVKFTSQRTEGDRG
jgi:hypothetical protein